MRYECDIYYSGFITVPVEADNEEQALEIAREEAAFLHNRREGEFNVKFLPSLEPWGEADTARKTE